jgi:ubiquinone/menaquinone biosynthesis C-methylase UbiE
MSDITFRIMSLGFWFRDIVRPPKTVLEEVGIEPGHRVLDFGCGPGSFAVAAADVVGRDGKVYALDVNPLAIQRVDKVSSRKGLTQVETIRSDGPTGLPDESLDVVLLYDVLHELDPPDGVLAELHRTLKPGGTLSASDHHMEEDRILSVATARGLFELSGRRKRTYSLTKR